MSINLNDLITVAITKIWLDFIINHQLMTFNVTVHSKLILFPWYVRYLEQ